MKSKKINFTRRSFIKNVTSVTAGIGLCGNKIWGAPAYIPNLLKPNSKINGVNINNPPAGDGTPSKKLFFHSS